MLPDDVELYLLGEIAVNRTLDRLMERIFNDSDPEDAREALKRIANQFAEELPQSLDALVYYRGMRTALNEDDFRWGALNTTDAGHRAAVRKERLQQYWWHLELFELEMKVARSMRNSSMALRGNWSRMDEAFRDSLILSRQRFALRCAGWLYKLNMPGAMDMCDAAVFEMFSLLYLRPSPAA